MAAFDGKAFGREIVSLVKDSFARTLAPLMDRLEAVERRLDSAPAAKDGVGLAGALIDRAGNLVLTLSDGTTRDLGCVVGKDGRDGIDGQAGPDGKDGRDGVDGEKGADGRDGIDGKAGENGRDGADGKDGRDGVDGQKGSDGRDGVDGKDGQPGPGFDDMEEEVSDDGRTIIRRYRKGDQVREFRHTLAVVLDRGVFKDGGAYEPGDAVTFGGSLWIAQAKTSERPGNGSAWRLAVKKGRDGKDASR